MTVLRERSRRGDRRLNIHPGPAETGTDIRPMRVAIIGAGFGGIGAAIELRRHGFDDVVVYDRASELGGTWHYNDYPGAACDVPSHLYSYSFAQRRHWSRICSPRDEILAYLREVAREHGVDALVQPNTEIAQARWDDGWTLE